MPIVNAQVTGLTHLREASNDPSSLVAGTDFAEIEYPDTVTVDLGDIWDSHLGMNLAVASSPTNVWYRVVAHEGFPLNRREVYVRAEMIRLLGASPVTDAMRRDAKESAARAGKGGEYSRELAYQGLGDVWEAYLLPLMQARRGGSTLYWGLRYLDAELDFVFISTNVVRIVSAKISRKSYNQRTDREHWDTIRAHWATAVTATKVSCYGAPVSVPPGVAPIITCESLETQGLSLEDFEQMIGLGGISWAQPARAAAHATTQPNTRLRLADAPTSDVGPDASHKRDLLENVLNANKDTALGPVILDVYNRKYGLEELGRHFVYEWTFQKLPKAKQLANFQSGVGELILKEKLRSVYPALTTDVDRGPWFDVNKATLPNPDYQVKGTNIYVDAVLIKSAKSPADAKQKAIGEDTTKRSKYNKFKSADAPPFVYWTAAFCLLPMKKTDLMAATVTTTPGAMVHLFFLDEGGTFARVDITS